MNLRTVSCSVFVPADWRLGSILYSTVAAPPPQLADPPFFQRHLHVVSDGEGEKRKKKTTTQAPQWRPSVPTDYIPCVCTLGFSTSPATEGKEREREKGGVIKRDRGCRCQFLEGGTGTVTVKLQLQLQDSPVQYSKKTVREGTATAHRTYIIDTSSRVGLDDQETPCWVITGLLLGLNPQEETRH